MSWIVKAYADFYDALLSPIRGAPQTEMQREMRGDLHRNKSVYRTNKTAR